MKESASPAPLATSEDLRLYTRCVDGCTISGKNALQWPRVHDGVLALADALDQLQTPEVLKAVQNLERFLPGGQYRGEHPALMLERDIQCVVQSLRPLLPPPGAPQEGR